ncbi:hypothetical protein J2126_000255 [Xanthobacter flavus]|nr:hypothetical protein [Xanthobacter flavus]
MAQNVGAAMDTFDAGPVEGAAHDALHGDPAQLADRRRVRQEHPRRRDPWPRPLDIGEDGVPDLLGQRQALLTPRLASKGYAACHPVDLIEVEVGDFAGPEAQSGQEQDGRSERGHGLCRIGRGMCRWLGGWRR